MTQEILGYFAIIFASFALIWSNKNWIKGLFAKKRVAVKHNEFDTISNNEAIQFALNWRNNNHGKKQKETVYRENGKTIANSKSYNSLQQNLFEIA